jgi:hypothetical protein
MINCFPDPVAPPNERSFLLVQRLKIIFYIQIGLGVLRILIGDGGNAIFDLFSAFVLWQGYTSLNFCSMIVYLFMTAMTIIKFLTALGTVIQNGSSMNGFVQIIFYVSLIFYIIAEWVAFESYKEFKALAYGDSASLLGGGGNSGMSLPMYNRGQNQQGLNSGKVKFLTKF